MELASDKNFEPTIPFADVIVNLNHEALNPPPKASPERGFLHLLKLLVNQGMLMMIIADIANWFS